MRRYLIFTTVCLGMLLSSINSSTASVALSTIIVDLDTTLVWAGWVLSLYTLISTVVMPLAGKVSETLGRRATFIAYTLLFTAGSILCALSTNVYFLIGSRALQAIGGGGFMPCAAGIVSDIFPEARLRYIGLFSSILPIGMIVGPNIGGWMVQVYGWRSIFWFNVPLGVLVLILSIWLLPTGKRSATTIDFAGSGLLFGALFAIMFGVTELGSTTGIPWLAVIVSFVLSVGLIIPFFRWERHTRSPIIDMELLSSRPFLAANIYNLLYGICGLGVLSLIPYYAVSVYNMSVLESGILLTPRSIGMMAASTVTAFSLERWGYRKPIVVGTLVLAAGFILLSLDPHAPDALGLNLSATVLLYCFVGICGTGSGICTPASSNACIELMPDKVATITGLRGMFRSMGNSFGVALATMLLNTIGDVQRAFNVVFIAAAVITLISIPSVFAMPSAANLDASKKRVSSH